MSPFHFSLFFFCDLQGWDRIQRNFVVIKIVTFLLRQQGVAYHLPLWHRPAQLITKKPKLSRNFSINWEEVRTKSFSSLLMAVGIGIPLILWRGMWENQMVTVTECLGPNLKKLFLMMERNFSVATVAMIGIQLVTFWSFRPCPLTFLHS